MKGKLANEVGSQYSHTASGRSVSSITNADAHTSAASSRLNRLSRRFKWTRPFRRKTKSGFCACAIRFRTSSMCGKMRVRPRLTGNCSVDRVCESRESAGSRTGNHGREPQLDK